VSAVQSSHADGVPIARLPEEVDAANAARVGAELAECVNRDVFELIVDLGGTQFIDSAGIDMLFRLSERLRQRRVILRVAIPPGSPLSRLAEIVGLRNGMPVHESVADALAAAGAAQAAVVRAPPAERDA
jgi:anti-anti-sigma factor